MTSVSPIRASHRLMLYIASSLIGGSKKYDPTPKELERVAKVFQKAGGSWERVFNGSSDDLNLLKKAMRVAAKSGYLTPKADWSK